MGSKTPKDIFFFPNLADIETVGINVLDLAQFSGIYQGLEFLDGRMILEDMPHHQDAALLLRQIHQLLAFRHFQGQGFFHKDIFAGQQSRFGQGIMGNAGGGDGHRLNLRIADFGKIGAGSQSRTALAALAQAGSRDRKPWPGRPARQNSAPDFFPNNRLRLRQP